MQNLARILDSASNRKISPNMITITGFIAHLPIAILIAKGQLIASAVLLVIFGLFDTLDGELARLQKRASPAGMLLDASTDRLKEVLIYAGIGYFLASTDNPLLISVIILACGASLSVSYIKAKGEAAIAVSKENIDFTKLNRMFSGGFASFELRISLLVIGLIANQLAIAVMLICIMSLLTATYRLIKISRYLSNVKN